MSDLTSQYIIAQEEHDYNKKYEEGTIVKHTIDNVTTAYTAKKNVPQFISILNENYWKKIASTTNSGGGSVDIFDEDVVATDAQRNKALANVSNQTANTTTGKIGYKVLDSTKTFAEQVTAENTIYEIRDVFNLGEADVIMPSGCILKFEGGKIINGTITSKDTIVSGIINIENVNGTLYDEQGQVVFQENYNKIANKEYISTQEQFDDVISRINDKQDVDVILAGKEFVMNQHVLIGYSSSTAKVHITGSDGTVIKDKNDIYYKKDFDTTYSSSTHYRCALKNAIKPFSIIVNNNDILGFETKKEIFLDSPFLKTNGVAVTSDGYLDEILIPYFECDYDDGKVIFGIIESEWSSVKFCITGTTTLNDTQYYTASIETYSLTGVRYITSNINYLYTTYGQNVIRIFNIDKNDVWFDDSYIYIPMKYNNVEVINRTAVAYTDNFLFSIRDNGNIAFNNIKFANFNGCFNIQSNGELINFSIQNCIFSNCLAASLRLVNNKTTTNSTRSWSVSNTEFHNICLSNHKFQLDSSKLGNSSSPAFIFDNVTFSSDKVYYKQEQILEVNSDFVLQNSSFCDCFYNRYCFRNGWIKINNCLFFNTNEFCKDISNFGRDCGLCYVGQLTDTNWETSGLHKCIITNSKFYNANSYFYSSSQHGIYCDNGRTDMLIENNIMYNCSGHTITARKYNSTTSTKNVIVRNNVIHGSFNVVGAEALTGEDIPVVDENIFLGKYNRNIDSRNTGINTTITDYEIKDNTIFVDKSIYPSLSEYAKSQIVPYSCPKNPRKLIYKSDVTSNSQKYHHFVFKINDTPVNEKINIHYNGFYASLDYDINIINSGYSNRVLNISKFNISGSRYNFGTAYLWKDTSNFYHIAIYCYEPRFTYYMHGGTWEIDAPEETIDSMSITIDDVSNLPSNISSLTQYVRAIDFNENAVIIISDYSVIFPTDYTVYPFLTSRFDYQYWNCIIKDTVDYAYRRGIITKYGIYVTEGINARKPTNISANDKGLMYYDTTNNKYICWNGTAWVNLDGTALS